MNVYPIKQLSRLAIACIALATCTSCGDNNSESEQNLASDSGLKGGKDVFTPLGLFNGNRICGNNKTIDECADGINSGGLRFKNDNGSLFGQAWSTLLGEDIGRSGCTFRGKGSDVQCRVSCDRISNNTLGLCSSQADGCEWDGEKCKKPASSSFSSLTTTATNYIKGLTGNGDITDVDSLVLADKNCKSSSISFGKCLSFGCTVRAGDTQCSASCSRIKSQLWCDLSSGCSWIGDKCNKD
ncbi:MAG: hypothetical protein AAF310_01725 [Myxococcota bacterium]